MKPNMIICGVLVAVLAAIIMTVGDVGLAESTVKPPQPALEKREQALQASIDRLNAAREQVYAEVIALRRELAALRQARSAPTNEAIVIRITLPPGARAEVKAEHE
jgi:uncharacterized protein YlxW (UPF0749 family)